MCFICAEGECRDRGRVHWEGFVWMGRESSAPAGRRDQCYIVGFVYAHVIQVSEALLDCQAACCCCRAAFFFSPFVPKQTFQWSLSGLLNSFHICLMKYSSGFNG